MAPCSFASRVIPRITDSVKPCVRRAVRMTAKDTAPSPFGDTDHERRGCWKGLQLQSGVDVDQHGVRGVHEHNAILDAPYDHLHRRPLAAAAPHIAPPGVH